MHTSPPPTSRNKATGRLILRLSSTFLVAALTGSAAPAAALDVEFTTANDPVFGNSRADDLYTAEVALDIERQGERLRFGERMFTDRRRGLRFDETYASLERQLPQIGAWRPSAAAGVLRVGRGLLGERVQNEVHRWVGSDEVDLSYPAENTWFPTLQIAATRPLLAGSRTAVAARVEAFAAPNFRTSAAASLALEHRLGRLFDLRLGAGLAVHHVETPLLGDRVKNSGPTWEAGLAWRRLVLRWTHNEYGTGTRHLALGVRLHAGAAGSAARSNVRPARQRLPTARR